jgi:hypothetical protein
LNSAGSTFSRLQDPFNFNGMSLFSERLTNGWPYTKGGRAGYTG